MALFRRKQQSSVLPDEVNQYYQSQRRERTGVAFMLGLLALVATFLVGLGVFFGGRYIYQKIQGDDKKTPATVQVDNGSNKVELPQIEGNGPTGGTTPGGDTEVPPPPTESTTPESAQNPSQTPALGDEPTTLPATGDEGH